MHLGRWSVFAMTHLQRVVYMNLFLFKQARLDDGGVNRWGRVVALIHSDEAFLSLHFGDERTVIQVVEYPPVMLREDGIALRVEAYAIRPYHHTLVAVLSSHRVNE